MNSSSSESTLFCSGLRRKRSLVPGSAWSNKELKRFRIEVHEESFFDFFLGNPPPPTTFSEDINRLLATDISNVNAKKWKALGLDCTDKTVSRFAKAILGITNTHAGSDNSVDVLSRLLLEHFGYDHQDLAIRGSRELRLDMNGGQTVARPDLCIETSMFFIRLLVQEDKRYHFETTWTLNDTESEELADMTPQAQVIAEAIASFQENNRIRASQHIQLEKSQLIPCITTLSTYPTFYLIRVTQDLADAVAKGDRPNEVTIVRRYTVPPKEVYPGNQMLDRDVRLHIFQCYASLKKYVLDHDLECKCSICPELRSTRNSTFERAYVLIASSCMPTRCLI